MTALGKAPVRHAWKAAGKAAVTPGDAVPARETVAPLNGAAG